MNKVKAIALASVLLLIPSVALADLEVKQACTDLVLDYAYFRDRPDAAGFASVFAEDGVLTVNGETFSGRKAIYDRLVNSVQGPSFRHLMSTIRIFPESDTRATGVSYVTVYLAPPGQNTVEGFAAVGEYHDEFVRTDEGWKISHRKFVPVYAYKDIREDSVEPAD